MELTILMPCLDEEKTIGFCINAAKDYLSKSGSTGEILVIDNGSSDRSAQIAGDLGARVLSCPQKGYGNALRLGLEQARGDIVIFGDCDKSYDFTDIAGMHRMLCETYDMVVGNRFNPVPADDAMCFSHRVGVRILSFLARRRYGCEVVDFHCGLRGVRKDALARMKFHTGGMEFATEFIAEGRRADLRIGQIPVTLHPDGRDGRSHLRTVRDGLRHLIYICKN